MSGLAGFGTGLTALGIWLHVVDPVTAAVLVVVCSVISQLQAVPAFYRSIAWTRLWPFLAGGVAGIPLGVQTLNSLDPSALKFGLGVLLILYTVTLLTMREMPKISAGGRVADGAVGAGSGFLGGVAGLSGPLMTIWCGLRHWRPDVQRAVYQPFNLLILSFTLAVYLHQDVVRPSMLWLIVLCIPATVLGTYIGIRIYGRLPPRRFQQMVLSLLLGSGIVLVVSNL